MKSSKQTRVLIESAMMIALATVLSIVKIIKMPYGGSVTVASMLPMVVLAYRHGIFCGLTAGATYAALQQLLGLDTLSYVTGWQSIVAIILLDYILSFTLVGLGGIFRRVSGDRSALVLGTLLVSVLRYVCHVISGATVWAGLSIPTEAALIYSIGYNATYMIPETIITTAAAYYLSTLIDFKRDIPVRRTSPLAEGGVTPYTVLGGTALLLGLVIDVWMIAPLLQDAETGEFSLAGLASVDVISVSVVTAITLAVSVYFFLKGRLASKEDKE